MEEIKFKDYWFDVKYKNNWIKVACGGGTGYAKQFVLLDGARKELARMKNMNESEIISYCTKNGWKYWDYYKDQIDEKYKIIN